LISAPFAENTFVLFPASTARTSRSRSPTAADLTVLAAAAVDSEEIAAEVADTVAVATKGAEATAAAVAAATAAATGAEVTSTWKCAPGSDVMIFKIFFFAKSGEDIGVFDLEHKAKLCKNLIVTSVLEKRQIFR
jgi:hypothetical protein